MPSPPRTPSSVVCEAIYRVESYFGASRTVTQLRSALSRVEVEHSARVLNELAELIATEGQENRYRDLVSSLRADVDTLRSGDALSKGVAVSSTSAPSS
ncbi:hypothetical protein A4X09_0g5873 [Tilletia walkeri]|uniref:Uncharacterized protein n=1 Tax=Tilletia walkeri TaxID=117179 RepID=A0A8X7N6L3_9BASI|nr:hypothetical protein A4X09_0g5873 [Tilletia walkeri]